MLYLSFQFALVLTIAIPVHITPFLVPCSLQEHPGSHPGALPLYTEEWAEELLSRVFSIISNLDAPDHGAEDGGQGEGLGSSEEMSFLLNGNSMFR